ncbi:MAG TPA: RNA polymerase sigma factor [Bryobacteraceae bacterium]|jgi:RNA polymerase sigma-70 factor (ECF subfamily)|nr:RNA polymerase sigma factor [Bryobacteraceae bacterium]
MSASSDAAGASHEDLALRCSTDPPDQDAWNEFYRRFSHRVASWVIKLAGSATRDEVEELVQETFLRAFRALPSFDPAQTSLAGYLHVITASTVVDRWRRRRREQEVSVSLQEEIQIAVMAAHPGTMDPGVLERALRTRLERVQPRQRLRVFEMLLDGKEADAIAERLGMSPATVYRMRQDCRRWVYEALAEIKPG